MTTKQDCVSELKVVIEIFKRILNDRNNKKYQNINYKRVSTKLTNTPKLMELICKAGFSKSKDGKRLIYDMQSFDILKVIYNELVSSLKQDDQEVIHELMSCGITEDEAIKALKMSKKDQFVSNDFIRSTPLCKLYTKLCTEQQIAPNISECRISFSNCISVAIIAEMLKQYSTNNDKLSHTNTDNTNLINHFNHLVSCHYKQFEEIYSYFNEYIYENKICHLTLCKSFRRNRRNRSEISQNERILTKMYSNPSQMVSKQVLDRIHCYFFHSLDIGFKISKKQKNNVPLNANWFKQNKHYKISKKKFNTLKSYVCGWRYFYWPFYRNNKGKVDQILFSKGNNRYKATTDGYKLSDWYIAQKYSSLKEELLQNHICHINETQWNNLCATAYIHSQTSTAKDMACSENKFTQCYGIKRWDRITKQHLISLMVYCNFDFLSHKFSETYRKLSEIESDQKLKTRHSNYYWLGRLLRECVECFTPISCIFSFLPFQSGAILYHGINQQFLFKSLNIQINCPFSTTTEYSVAINFCEYKGMILEIQSGFDFHDTYNWGFINSMSAQGFKCWWISDYPNECEVLFIGGIGRLRINNIIDMRTGINYSLYVKALSLISGFKANKCHAFLKMFKQQEKFQKRINEVDECNNLAQSMDLISKMLFKSSNSANKVVIRMACLLLSHEIWRCNSNHPKAKEFQQCPDYIRNVMHEQCSNANFIVIDSDNQIHKDFFADDNGWISLDLLYMLFPNVKFIDSMAFASLDNICQSQLTFISKHEESKLKKVLITLNKYDIETSLDSQDTKDFNKYKNVFHRFGWDLRFAHKKWTKASKKINKLTQLGNVFGSFFSQTSNSTWNNTFGRLMRYACPSGDKRRIMFVKRE
eukprot:296261_1